MKLCLVGSKKPYPAFDSTLSILRSIVGEQNVLACRIHSFDNVPTLLRPLACTLSDFIVLKQVLYRRKKENFDVILMFQGYYPVSCILFRFVGLNSAIYVGGSSFKWSSLEHKSSIGRLIAYSNLVIEKICHRCTKTTITLSKSMSSLIGNHCGDAFFALPRIDQSFFTRFKVIDPYWTRQNIVGFLGELSERKGIENFLEAIPKMRADLSFLVVGKGPLLNRVKERINDLNLSTRVQLTGFVDYSELPKYYNQMKLYVLPSYIEGIPSTVFEAMACGTPVLATPVGGIPDVIQDGRTGFLLTKNDPDAIAFKINCLLSNDKLMNKISSSACKYVHTEFTSEKVAESWRAIINSLYARSYNKQ
jgi:glycosyltransferase involved in cell wall biosynthesis